MHILNLTPMMDILTVLVVFLLVTAVFMGITVMELSIPASGAAAVPGKRNIAIEVIVRRAGLQISDGSTVQASIPKKDDAYDIELLSKMLVRLKEQYPEKQDATVLMEPRSPMTISSRSWTRSARQRCGPKGAARSGNRPLPNISIGDAP